MSRTISVLGLVLNAPELEENRIYSTQELEKFGPMRFRLCVHDADDLSVPCEPLCDCVDGHATEEEARTCPYAKKRLQ